MSDEPRKAPTVTMMRAENKSLKRMFVGTAGTYLLLAALVLAGCEVSNDPEPDLDRVRALWTMNVPVDAEVEDYWSSEVDFQGGRDDLYVISIPEKSRVEAWDTAGYTEGVPLGDSPSPADIARSSGASIAEDVYDELTCRKPIRQGQDYILICYHQGDDLFYVFEQIF